MRLVVITGMGGSGKSSALRALEDAGYYAIDNMPIGLIDKLVELFGISEAMSKVALVVDVRTHQGSELPDEGILSSLPSVLDGIRERGHDVDLAFLDAANAILARRYSETRRRHPLSTDGSVEGGIAEERKWLEPLRQAATTTINTSEMSVHDLKREIEYMFAGDARERALSVTVLSFGFKYGLPRHADLVMDMRFLPNPYFVDELRPQTGNEPDVARYVLERPETVQFFERFLPLLDYLIPQYRAEGKAYLTVAIGCTGGRHRSVAVANRISEWLGERSIRVQVTHRDAAR
ncbi:MAG: RNase adapter RapZ [Myxococcota bacterium]